MRGFRNSRETVAKTISKVCDFERPFIDRMLSKIGAEIGRWR